MLTPELLAYLNEQNANAQAKRQTLAEYALRWILEQKGVTSVLVGASSVEQLKKNIKAGL
jgi:L-glyceraldehyde 3-phosphate reductase